MPDKDLEELKKKVAAEIKQLAKKTADDCKQMKALREQQAGKTDDAAAAADAGAPKVDLRKALQDYHKDYLSEADETAARINSLLKKSAPTDPKAIPEWQKGMDKWYRDLIEKEPGFDIGDGLKLSGQISIKDKKALIFLNGKFP